MFYRYEHYYMSILHIPLIVNVVHMHSCLAELFEIELLLELNLYTYAKLNYLK